MTRGEGVMGSLYTCLESSCQYILVEDVDGSSCMSIGTQCSDGKWGWNVNQGALRQSLPSHVERTQQVAD